MAERTSSANGPGQRFGELALRFFRPRRLLNYWDERMRIAFVITGLGMGGAEVQVCNLAAGWVRRGAVVQIISMLDKIAPHPQLADGSIVVRTLGMERGRWSPRHLARYVREARRFQPDVVHAQLFHASLLARVGRPLVRKPLVCTAQVMIEVPERFAQAPARTRLREL